ncbi:MAG: hypothetical protein MR270_03340 [Erysipelotrichaceae bacterium]|nr:hypothetical protein [Erysipelotrichaceae bacterium]
MKNNIYDEDLTLINSQYENELKDTINRIERKYIRNHIGIIFGVFICFVALIFYLNNPTLIAGVLSVLFIGVIVIFLNVFELSKRKNRVSELKEQLNKIIEMNIKE